VMSRKGHGYRRSFMRNGHASWDEKAFGDCIAIRGIDYERKPAEVGTAM
jgi:hypothetical protein